jgi:hypothetical protein
MSEPGKDDGVIVKQESVEDGVPGGVEATKIGLLDRVGLSIVRYFASPIRLREVATAIPMYAVESVYDARKVTIEGNEFGNTYKGLYDWNVGPLPDNPDVRATLDVLGDMWEISVGQTLVRGGLYALYESIGKEPLSDDDTFALSLLIPLVLKSAHTLGLISIFGIHDRIGNPAPQMLIGQIVASMALMVAHYSARNKEIRKDLGLPDISVTGKIKNMTEKGIRALFENSHEEKDYQKRVESATSQLAYMDSDE